MIDVGKKVGGYEIVAHLKPGGMATLFLARRVGPKGFTRPVAIKVVHPHLAGDPDLVKMFLDEARLSALIQHPNVVHVEELGEEQGTYFLAMEYLHGESLSSLLAALSRVERALPVEVAAWVALSAAAGLHAAHETRDADGRALGLVHRDVSPQNVLVSLDGHVKVIDFGIAKAAGGAVRTETGALKGKLAYMSPEQAHGRPIDRRTDVYALGIVLWEMLTMRRLFSGSEVEVLDGVRNPRLVAPSFHVPTVPHALDDVVLHALAPRVEDRYATAEELQRAIARACPDAVAGGAALARIVAEQLGDRIEARRRQLVTGADGDDATLAAGRTVTRAERDAAAIAVMPFRTIGGTDATLGEGVADELRDVLSRVRGLRVKGSASTRDAEDASAYGERLGVGNVVTGRVHGEPARVRLAIALTTVDDGFQSWSNKLEFGRDEVWDAVESVARGVVDALGSAGLRGQRAKLDEAAVQLALDARKLAQRPTIDDPGAAVVLYESAQRIAPRDPVILASCATALVRTTYWANAPANATELARATAERAIELGPELPEPWVAMAQIKLATADTVGAVRALRRAVANGPSVAEPHDLLARILSDADLLDEALRLAEHALWLDPKSLFARRERVRIFALQGDWDAATRELLILRGENPEHFTAIGTRVSLWAGRALAPQHEVETLSGMKALAAILWRVLETRRLEPGDIAAADDAIRWATQPRARRFFHQLKAELHGYVGDHESAAHAVVASVDAGLEDIAWLDRCQVLRDVRHHPLLVEPAGRVRARADLVRRAWDEW